MLGDNERDADTLFLLLIRKKPERGHMGPVTLNLIKPRESEALPESGRAESIDFVHLCIMSDAII